MALCLYLETLPGRPRCQQQAIYAGVHGQCPHRAEPRLAPGQHGADSVRASKDHEKRTLMILVGWLKPFAHASQIMVERGQQFPADLILIASSNEDGLAYIATADLDGYGLCARCGRLGQCGVSSSAFESTTCW